MACPLLCLLDSFRQTKAMGDAEKDYDELNFTVMRANTRARCLLGRKKQNIYSCLLDGPVRNLGIFMFNLIQKNSSKFVTINICTCELLVATMMNILIMFKSTKTLLNIEIVRLEAYPAEGPMLKAPVAPRALLDIVRCSMSRTTVDAG